MHLTTREYYFTSWSFLNVCRKILFHVDPSFQRYLSHDIQRPKKSKLKKMDLKIHASDSFRGQAFNKIP